MAKKQISTFEFMANANPLIAALKNSAEQMTTQNTHMEAVRTVEVQLMSAKAFVTKLEELVEGSNVTSGHGGILS